MANNPLNPYAPINEFNYDHPSDPALNDLHQAMEWSPDHLPHIRVSLGSDNITITGDVNLVDKVKLWDGTDNLVFDMPNNDGETAPISLPTESHNMVFNGSTWDRMRGNKDDGILAKITNFPAFPTEIDVGNFPAFPTSFELGTTTLTALETITVNQGTAGTEQWKVNIGTNGEVKLVAGSAVIGKVSLVDSSGNNNDANHPVYVSANISNTEPIEVSGNVTADVTFPNIYKVSKNTSDNTANNPIYVEGSVTIDQTAGDPTLVKYIDSGTNLQMDMVERLRVAQSNQSWWYAPTVDKDGDLRYIESATGTNAGSIFVQNLSSINLSSGTDANGSFIRISRRRHKMRPGVSMLAAFSVNWNGYVPDGNVTKRVGMFTNYNGIFYEMTDDLQIVVRRRLTDGTLVEKRTARADFNLDKLDGTGTTGLDLRPVVHLTSAITAYVSKSSVAIPGDGTVYRVVFTVADPTQFYVSQKGRITGVTPALYNGTVMVTAISGSNVTFVYNVDPGSFVSLSSAKFEHSELHNQYLFGFDFGGSRIGRVRFFMDGPAGRTAIHIEDFGSELSTPFANAPSVSTRYEIFNSGAPGRLPNLTISSEVVNVEAELELNPGFGVAHAQTNVNFNKNTDIGTEFAVLGIGLRAGEPYQRADLQLQRVQFSDLGNLNPQNAAIFEWSLLLNPTFGGTAVPAATDIAKATRMWDYATGTTVSGGIRLTGGYFQGTQQMEIQNSLNFLNLGSNIEYTDADKVVLVAKMLVGGSSNSIMRATMNFIEAL